MYVYFLRNIGYDIRIDVLNMMNGMGLLFRVRNTICDLCLFIYLLGQLFIHSVTLPFLYPLFFFLALSFPPPFFFVSVFVIVISKAWEYI